MQSGASPPGGPKFFETVKGGGILLFFARKAQLALWENFGKYANSAGGFI